MVKDFEAAGEAPGTGSVRIIDWKVEHRIGVKAPASIIWEAITELERWPEWNPLYPKAAGLVRIGQTLDLTLALPGAAPRRIAPVVLDWVPNEQLHWRMNELAGLVRRLRYIEIEALGSANCIVSNGEIFKGLLGTTVLRRNVSKLRQGYAAMGVALRDRAESLWRAQGELPTSQA
jgi:hypothetical protein